LFTKTQARIEAGEFHAGPACHHRLLVVVLMEAGLRGGDACTPPFTPVLDDSAWLALVALER